MHCCCFMSSLEEEEEEMMLTLCLTGFSYAEAGKKQYNDRRDFRGTMGLKREVVLADFEGPESYSGGLKIRKAPKTKI